MKSTTKPGFAKAALAAAALSALLPFGAQAASQLQTAATGGASADLNFNVVIPRVLFLQVGTGPASTMAPWSLRTEWRGEHDFLRRAGCQPGQRKSRDRNRQLQATKAVAR